MARLKRLYEITLGRLHRASRRAMAVGAVTMAALYITALFARAIAPYVDYVAAMNIYRGSLEAAPAAMVAGIVAGLLGDLILRDGKKDGR